MNAMTKAKAKRFFRKNYEGWLFNLPLAVGLIVFTAVPVITSFVFSLHDTNGTNRNIFVGLDNYIRIFTRDSNIGQVVVNTLVYSVVSIPLNLVLSYFLALLVNVNLKGVKTFRVLYYLPCIIPLVVSGLLWKDIYDPTMGVFNAIIQALGGESFPFFTNAKTAMFSLILMNVWLVGGGMILWLSAFKNIPKELYECASLEGAGAFRRMASITIPMSTPMIFYNLIMSLIGTLQYNGTLTYAPNEGMGVDKSLYLYAVKLYREAFESYQLGYGSALAWVLLVVIAVLTAVVFKTSKWVFYGEDA